MKISAGTFCRKRRRDGETERQREGFPLRRSILPSLFLPVPLSLCLSILLTACGKIGDPLPPIPRAKFNIDELSVEQQGTKLTLSFPFIRTTRTRLQRVDVYRLIEPTDAPQGLPIETFSEKAHVIYSIPADEIPLNNSKVVYNDGLDMRSEL